MNVNLLPWMQLQMLVACVPLPKHDIFFEDVWVFQAYKWQCVSQASLKEDLETLPQEATGTSVRSFHFFWSDFGEEKSCVQSINGGPQPSKIIPMIMKNEDTSMAEPSDIARSIWLRGASPHLALQPCTDALAVTKAATRRTMQLS